MTRIALPDPFPLHHGGTLHGASIDVSVYGPDGPATVVLGGISASSDLAWWPGLVGPGCSLDPSRDRLIGAEWVVADDLDTRDQARALLCALDHLGVGRVRVIGASYGGNVGLALATLAPERVTDLVVVAAAHRSHALASGWRHVQRRILASGLPDAVEIARALAMTTYRSADGLDARFGNDRTAVGEWLDHHGRAYRQRFDAPRFLALSSAIDRHDIDPALVRVPTTVIGFDSDALVPPFLLEELAEQLPRLVAYHLLASPHGHDGFLLDAVSIDALLAHQKEAA